MESQSQSEVRVPDVVGLDPKVTIIIIKIIMIMIHFRDRTGSFRIRIRTKKNRKIREVL